MSILITPPENLTPAQATAKHVLTMAKNNYEFLLRAQKNGTDAIWSNAAGLTPQQACDALGTGAARMFQLHGLLTDFILSIQQLEGLTSNVTLPTNAFTLNPDGTVTVDPNTAYAPPA